jgi:chromosome segregation ATPase
VEGYVARDLELIVGQAVEQAVSNAVVPLLGRIESQAAAQALLMEELKELRKDRTALKEQLAKLMEAEQNSPEAMKAVIDNAVVPYMGQVEAVWAEIDRVNEENARLKIELEGKHNPWWKFWRGLKVV